MAIGDLFKKKRLDPELLDPEDHRELLVRRARMLIEDLVSPLSQPNQRLIDELLTIISQTAAMPANLVNKDEVMKTTKALLVQLIRPIPNPNKKLIDELLLVMSDTEKALALSRRQTAAAPGASAAPMQAAAPVAMAAPAAPAPSRVQDSEEAKKQRTVMNLILQQIKELINITNNLNVKTKSFEPRIESMEKVVWEIREKNENLEKKLSEFEKNMEKFIGLYEVVTNQFNPFVESGESLRDFQLEPEKQEGAEDAAKAMPEIAQGLAAFANAGKQKKKAALTLAGKEITNLTELEDALMALDGKAFDSQRDAILLWLEETSPELFNKVKDVSDKKEFTKQVLRHI